MPSSKSLFDAIKKANNLKRALTAKEKVVGPTYQDWADSWKREHKAEMMPLGWTFKKYAVWDKPDGWRRDLEHKAESYQEGLNWLLNRNVKLSNIKELPWSNYENPKYIMDNFKIDDPEEILKVANSNNAYHYERANNSRKAFYDRMKKVCLDPLSYVDDEMPAVREIARAAVSGGKGAVGCGQLEYKDIPGLKVFKSLDDK